MPLNLRFHLVFWCLLSNRHFGTLTLKFLLNPITKGTVTTIQTIVKRFGIIVFRKCFAADHQSDILELLLWNSRPISIVAQNMANLEDTVTHLLFTVFALVYWYVSCKQNFGVLTVKFLLNQITTHKMASLQNIVTRLKIIVVCYSYSAYHQSDTLEHLPWNCHNPIMTQKMADLQNCVTRV